VLSQLIVQQLGSTAQTELQHVPSEHAPLLWGVVHGPLAVAPHRPTQFESAVAAQPASQVTRQQSGYMAHTVLQQSLSEHPGSVCGVRQLSVPLPQFCAVLHGVNASVSEVARATSAEGSVCTKFIGEYQCQYQYRGSISGARCYPRFADVPSSAA
jgi:hypothetical protein